MVSGQVIRDKSLHCARLEKQKKHTPHTEAKILYTITWKHVPFYSILLSRQALHCLILKVRRSAFTLPEALQYILYIIP